MWLKGYGRHVATRTPHLYRANFEVNNLKPFPYLVFPQFHTIQKALKRTGLPFFSCTTKGTTLL
jgi:hypothetical protein